MRILISGSTGFVGEALVRDCMARGYDVMRLVRVGRRSMALDDGTRCATWDPCRGMIDRDLICGVDAVVHLAGEPIAEGRWTVGKKQRIYESRVVGTQLLARTIGSLANPPRVMVSMSAIGFYGLRGETVLDETSEKGEGFLADVAQAWEQAAQLALDAGGVCGGVRGGGVRGGGVRGGGVRGGGVRGGVRVVCPRLGMVLGKQGGVLSRLVPIFRLGLGGVAGSGDQYWSWVSMTDVISAIHFMIEHETLAGPVNLVSPQPVTNREFVQALGRALRRPTLLPGPGWMMRLMMGEMAEAMVLGSTRVFPKRLLDAGFVFDRPELDVALGVGEFEQ